MHKYETYGSWDNCSNYWNNANENDLIEITNESVKESSFLPTSLDKISTFCADEMDKNVIIINKIKIYSKYNIYILNKIFLSKKLIINNFNNNNKIYGKYKNR